MNTIGSDPRHALFKLKDERLIDMLEGAFFTTTPVPLSSPTAGPNDFLLVNPCGELIADDLAVDSARA